MQSICPTLSRQGRQDPLASATGPAVSSGSDSTTIQLPPSELRRVHTEWAKHPTLAALGMYAVVAAAAGIAAYLAIFTQFAGYDDEGTVLVTLKAFARGDVLYRDVYSPYGPFYYELFGGLFALTGLAVSNNASRLIVVAVWVATSCLYGVSVQRLTGRLLLGISAMIVAFAVLRVLVNEPMHPHGLATLLMASLTLLLVAGPPRRKGAAGAFAGALLGAMLLTKVNLGGFALAAISLAAVLTVEPLYRRRWVRWPVVVAFVLLPTVLLSRSLRENWVRDLIEFELFASVALLAAARPLRPLRGETDQGMSLWVLSAVFGFCGSFVAIVGRLLVTGSSLAALYDGAVVQGVKIADVFKIPLAWPPAALGIAAAGAAALTVRLRSSEPGSPSLWPGSLRVVAGLAVWLTIAKIAPFSLNPAGNPIALPLVLAWVAVMPPAGIEASPYMRFLRVALPALALVGTLQIYPVAGSQVGIASVSFVAVGGICVGDGLRYLHTWSAARGRLSLDRFVIVATVVLVTLCAQVALDAIVRPAATNAVAYRDQRALPFPGAGLIHPSERQVSEYTDLVHLLRIHRCTTFIGYPNVNSLYLWSGIDTPKPSAPGAWPAVLDSGAQQRVVVEMRASPRPCALRNGTAANFWLQNRPSSDSPLLRYMVDDFNQVAAVGDWQFLTLKRPR